MFKNEKIKNYIKQKERALGLRLSYVYNLKTELSEEQCYLNECRQP